MKKIVFLFLLPLFIISSVFIYKIGNEKQVYFVKVNNNIDFSKYDFILLIRDYPLQSYPTPDSHFNLVNNFQEVTFKLKDKDKFEKLVKENKNIVKVIESKSENDYYLRGYNLKYSITSSIFTSFIFMLFFLKNKKLQDKKKMFLLLLYFIFLSHTLINILIPSIPPTANYCEFEKPMQTCLAIRYYGSLNYIYKTPIDIIIVIMIYKTMKKK